jgi:hypothetical protein
MNGNGLLKTMRDLSGPEQLQNTLPFGFARKYIFISKAAFLVLLAMLLSGCGRTSADYSSPIVVLDQNPKTTYRLDFKFQGAPGPFTQITPRAFYQVTEPGCVRPLWGSGAVITPSHSLILPFNKIYQAVFHLDAIRDQDYFGFGMCKWSFQNIGLEFSSPTTDFVAHVSKTPEAFGSFGPTGHFFLDRDYSKKPEIGSKVFAEEKDFYSPEMGSQFSITTSVEKLETQ